MNEWQVKDPLVFFGAASLVVAYVIYMMIRRKKSDRAGFEDRDTEL